LFFLSYLGICFVCLLTELNSSSYSILRRLLWHSLCERSANFHWHFRTQHSLCQSSKKTLFYFSSEELLHYLLFLIQPKSFPISTATTLSRFAMSSSRNSHAHMILCFVASFTYFSPRFCHFAMLQVVISLDNIDMQAKR